MGGAPDYMGYVKRAWELTIAEPVLLIVGGLVVSLALLVSSVVVIGPLLLTGPLLVGYLLVIRRRLSGEPAEFEALFSGFQDFGRTLVAGLILCAFFIAGMAVTAILNIVLNLIPCIGTILGIVVGLAVSIAVGAVTFFYMPLVALTNVAPGEAASRCISYTMENLQQTAILALINTALILLGTLACGVGVVITFPMAAVIQVIAYRELFAPATGAAA